MVVNLSKTNAEKEENILNMEVDKVNNNCIQITIKNVALHLTILQFIRMTDWRPP
jgi:hypothetical protein